MAATSPRLLVALRPSDELAAAIGKGLPGIPWQYLDRATRSDREVARALLVGSISPDLRDHDASSTPGLEFVQRLYTGLDDFPFERFPPPIRISGNVGGYAPFVAEHAVALALAAARSILPAARQLERGQLRPAPEMRTLWGQRGLLLGYGSIGRGIAQRLGGFGLRLTGLNRTGRMAPGVEAMLPASELDSALADADLVFDARPLTRATRGSIGAGQLDRMPATGIYVNVGRAGTVDEEALFAHLTRLPTFRAALDVWWEEGFSDERLTLRHPWTELPNFVGTPHCAGSVPAARAYALSRAIENLARFFRGDPLTYLADPSDYAGPMSAIGSVPGQTSR